MFCPDCGLENPAAVNFCNNCGCPMQEHPILNKRYRMEGRVGSGGMADVFRVHDLVDGCERALKTLTVASQSEDERHEAVQRFEREAVTLAGLAHPGLPKVVDSFSEGGRHYIVQTFINGRTLAQHLKSKGTPGLPEAWVVGKIIQVLDILEYLHSQTPPILHRDVKPSNVMIENDSERVYLIDFGIVRLSNMAGTQTKIGTEGYAPREQYEGKSEPRSDLYAVAATLHHLLSGKKKSIPFEFDPIETLVPTSSPHIIAALSRGLQQNACDRFASAAEMKLALRPQSAPRAKPSAVRVAKPIPPPARPHASGITPVPCPTGPAAFRQLGPNAQGFDEIENPQDGTVLITLADARFRMGSDEGSREEKPAHEVALESFCLARAPVTNAQFRKFVTATGLQDSGAWQWWANQWGDDAPAVGVSWGDAMAYCSWAGLRLPTEAEWEYAATGPRGLVFPWGNDWDAAHWGQPRGVGGRGRAFPVGAAPTATSWCGAIHMAGNILQWCSSKRWAYPYRREDGREDVDSTSLRVLRGSSWVHRDTSSFRCTARSSDLPNAKTDEIGFRCALSV